jgi:hypothetical protein
MTDVSQGEEAKPASRPRAWIASVEFSDGTTLRFDNHEVIVFVGPNNAGKSSALRDIFNKLNNRTYIGQVVAAVTLRREGNSEDAVRWAKISGRRQPGGRGSEVYQLGFGNIGAEQFRREWENAEANGLHNLTPLVVVYLTTEGRLAAANQVSNIDFVEQRPSVPLQILHEQDDLEKKLSKLFKQAFGSELIVNRGRGAHISLHFGERPIPPTGKDRISIEFRQAVNDLPQISAQGDGIRSFVGVMLNAFVVDRDMIIIDEPDAFLHPPQAALLGKMLAEEIIAPRQLIVATHNSDFLRGVLDATDSPVRIIRLQRDGEKNKIKELSPSDVRDVWKDPLLRYSNILDGLFHKGAIVCESDSDCRFYAALIDVVSKEKEAADLLLVQGGGKSRIATIVKSLRAIGVPVRAVSDFDIFAEEGTFKATYEALGGDWSRIEEDWRATKRNIESRRPELPTDEAAEAIKDILASIKSRVFPDKSADAIKEILKQSSAWSEAKRMGAAFIPSGEATTTYQRLAAALKAVGLFVVEVGELEQYCKSLGGHGPGWVNQVLERNLATDPELEAGREFARELLKGW